MRKLAEALKSLGRFLSAAIKNMADVRPGFGTAGRNAENMPPDWERKDLGI